MKPLIILLTNVLAHSEVPGRLALYANRVDVAILDVQGSVSTEEYLSECITTMVKLSISHFLFSTDFGGHAYWLRQSESGFPDLRKFKAKRFPRGNIPEEGFWEEVDVPGFNKPYARLVDVLMQEIQPSHTLLVCDSPLDHETAKDVSFEHSGRIYEQSSDEWLSCANPEPWQPQAVQSVPSTQLAPRYFECVDHSQNASKFWEISMHSNDLGYQVRYGRIGTKGQVKDKAFPNSATARRAYIDIIQSKLRKGYIER